MLAAWGRIIFSSEHRTMQDFIPVPADQFISSSLPGWTAKDLPIADSDDMVKIVEKTLNYDSYVYRSYQNADVEILLYIAYWKPAQIAPAMVEAHTPDICWVANGWEMHPLPPLTGLKHAGQTLDMRQYRRFVVHGQDTYVGFWQINGHQLRDMTSTAEAHLSTWERTKRRFYQVWDGMLNPPGQQVFVRISSSAPLDQLTDTAPFQAVFDLIERLEEGELMYQPRNTSS